MRHERVLSEMIMNACHLITTNRVRAYSTAAASTCIAVLRVKYRSSHGGEVLQNSLRIYQLLLYFPKIVKRSVIDAAAFRHPLCSFTREYTLG